MVASGFVIRAEQCSTNSEEIIAPRRYVSMWRRMAVIGGGLAMAVSFGLAGVGVASAAAPTLKVKPGSKWTLEDHGIEHTGGCEVDTMSPNGTFTSDLFGDSGTWSGGGSTITVTWTTAQDRGVIFSGTFTTTPVKEYKGSFNTGDLGVFVKGMVHTFHGQTC
jgi:hypothetical protein